MTVRFGNYRIAFYSKYQRVLCKHASNCMIEQSPYSCCQVWIKNTTTHFLLITDNHDLLGTVLGLSAHFAVIFLPKLHREPSIHQSLKALIKITDDFTIFSILVPSLSIFVFLVTYNYSAWTSLTVLDNSCRMQWAQPRSEAIALFVVGTLWLGEFWIWMHEYRYWSAASDGSVVNVSSQHISELNSSETPKSDIIGHIQCDGLTGQRTATKNGDSTIQFFFAIVIF